MKYDYDIFVFFLVQTRENKFCEHVIVDLFAKKVEKFER